MRERKRKNFLSLLLPFSPSFFPEMTHSRRRIHWEGGKVFLLFNKAKSDLNSPKNIGYQCILRTLQTI